LLEESDIQIVRDLLLSHSELTASRRAKWILDNWRDVASRFIKVFPHEFKRVLGMNRSEQAYIPAPPFAELAQSGSLPPEQVQQGQLLHGQVQLG